MKKIETKYIDVTLENFDDSFSRFNNETLNEELGNYIFKECTGINLRNNIIIRIKPEFEITEDEKEELVRMIRFNYGMHIREILIHKKYENIKKLLLMIFGILFVLLSELIPLNNVYIIKEVLLIIGWVGIWEAVYSLIFVDIKNKFETKRLKQLTTCRIEFI